MGSSAGRQKTSCAIEEVASNRRKPWATKQLDNLALQALWSSVFMRSARPPHEPCAREARRVQCWRHGACGHRRDRCQRPPRCNRDPSQDPSMGRPHNRAASNNALMLERLEGWRGSTGHWPIHKVCMLRRDISMCRWSKRRRSVNDIGWPRDDQDRSWPISADRRTNSAGQACALLSRYQRSCAVARQ